jgi:hypothetical protein
LAIDTSALRHHIKFLQQLMLRENGEPAKSIAPVSARYAGLNR